MGNKIIRRPDFAGGGLTDEEKKRMAQHTALWIQRAMRTEPADPVAIEAAIKGLYRVSGLAEPRVILVPSPFVMAMVGGIAATFYGTRAATDAAAATRDATWAATYTATDDATRAATRVATDAMDAATDAATNAATRAATDVATNAATKQWRALAASFVGERYADAALNASKKWTAVYQGGNMWAAWDCYLTACRDVLGLRLPSHDAYAYWEQAAINGGFRWMHPKFCLVSDFPQILRVNSRNQPHAEFGPSHRWRDGFSIWHLNGVRVEQWMAESHPDDLDARRVLQIENVDQRREVIRRMGSERLVAQLEAKVLDVETREVGGRYELLAIDMNHGEPWRFLKMVNQSIGAVHVEAVPRQCETVRHAINWRASQDINRDWFPSQLT